MEATSTSFRCAKCGRPYDWKPEFVGKTAQCPCGHTYKVPAPPAESNPVSLVHIEHVEEPIPTAEAAIVSLFQPVSSPNRARAPMELPDEELDAKTEAELKELAVYGDNDGQAKPNAYLDYTLPLILLGIGLMLAFGEASYMTHRHHVGLPTALFEVSKRLFLNIALMIVAMLAAGKFTGINFGNIPSAIVKIGAIYVAPTTLGGLLTAVLGADNTPFIILGYAVSTVLIWALLAYLFRLDVSQTLACVFCIGLLTLTTRMFVLGST